LAKKQGSYLMPKVVIQVAKCEKAKTEVDAAGRTMKFGAKIFDTAGVKYSPGPKLYGMFREGEWYEIFYEDKSFQGNPFKQIMTVNPTQPLTYTGAGAVITPIIPAHAQPHDKDIQIWCNSMLQRAIDHDKVDPWNEEACCELLEVQKRVFRRTFLGEEPAPVVPGRANGPQAAASKQAAYATGPAPGGDDMMDEIPFD